MLIKPIKINLDEYPFSAE